MFRKRSFIVFISSCITTLIAASAFAASISIVTGEPSGTYYPIGRAIAVAVRKNSNIQATVETAGVAFTNINLIALEEIEVAFAQTDTISWAYNGQVMYEGRAKKNIRAIASLYPETVQVVVKPGIKTFAHLLGKRVGVGAPGSSTEGDARTILNALGLTYDDMRAEFIDFGRIISHFKEDKIDAGFVVASAPTSALLDLTTTKYVSLLNFDSESMQRIVSAYPFFVPNLIPGGTYKGIDEDISTPAVMAVLITHDNMPEDVIYDFVKGMFDNLSDIQTAHVMAKQIKLENATKGLTIPVHPGAAKYYKEMGINVN